ncbi:hypothetical protein FH972_022931 [Carpinus fangiana]|uniref:Nuclear segregation protein Bfr1 n=1 Tax=Carpinus fangiana TaxID=176857 RepID=A0A5N6KTP3_9ROSI|nr:hypothetical protein FH972_022931 [Carpinus fangiana]
MADLATPSAADMATSSAGADKPTITKPERPDEAAFQAESEKRKKAIDKAQDEVRKIQTRVNEARGTGDSPVNDRKQELKNQLQAIRDKQAVTKKSRGSELDKIKAIDAQMKTRINELKNAKGASTFKSAEDIDKEIARLEAQVETGKMKLVDEKKALADISSHRKQKKAFAGFDEKQKEIDKLKAQIADIKAGIDKNENKAEQDEYTKIKTELDAIFDAEGQRKGGLNKVRDELREARTKQDKLYQEFKEFKDQYYEQKRAAYAYEREAAKVRDAKRKIEREAYLKEKRQYQLKQRIEEASEPAYLDEIRAADTVLRMLDPASASAPTAPEVSKFAATAQRTVTADGLEGKRITKKDQEEEEYFAGTGGKKGKKGKKGQAKQTISSPAASSDTKALSRFFQPGVHEQFTLAGVEPPSTSEQIPEVVKKVQEKKEFWQKDQKRKTQENIDNAQKAFEKEVAEDTSDSKQKRTTPAKSNGDAPVAEVTQKVADASLESPADAVANSNGANGESASAGDAN